MSMLEIKNVHKSFFTYTKPRLQAGIFHQPGARKVTSELQVLRGVDLTVEKGDVVAILGPSGSGKTTLLRCLNFLETADAGQLTFDGETFDLAQASRADIARLRKKTAFVFQNYNLFRNKTALQNVTEGLNVARRMPREQADAIGRRMLEKVGLADRADYYPRQLSGGQQQRVALARALVIEPSVLLFDEPLSNLDATLRVSMRTEIRRIQQEVGITAIYVTHDQSEAMALSDQIIIMNKGVVAQIGTPQEIYYHPVSEFVADFIGEANFLRGKMTGTENGLAVLDVEGERLAVVPREGMRVGEEYTVVLRPESAALSDEGGLPCTVELSCFMGSYQNYHVRVGNTLVKLAENDPRNKRIYRVGEQCHLTFAPDTVHVL